MVQKLYPPKFSEVKLGRTRRKNQAILDFLEDTKKGLSDDAKNFGLYMKLYKGFGKEKIQRAANIALRNENVADKDKFRYFLGILKRDETPQTKEKAATVNQEVLARYKKLKAGLKKKMTPKIQKRANVRTKILHKVSKNERKQR